MKNIGAMLFWVWTLALCVFFFYLFRNAGESSFYDGQNIEITIGSGQMIVIPQTVEIKAAATGYFLLDNREGSIIFGEKVAKPIGWVYPEYWFSESEITGGNWLVQDGSNITFQIASEGVMKLEVIPDPSSVATIRMLLFLGFVVIWFASIVLIVEFN